MTERWTNQCIDGHVTNFTGLGPPESEEMSSCQCGAPFEGPWNLLTVLPRGRDMQEERVYIEERIDEAEDRLQELEARYLTMEERINALERDQNRDSTRTASSHLDHTRQG